MRDQFIQCLLNRARTDPRIVVITGDLGFGVLDEFARTLPKQFINAGVAEQNMTGLAAGMALRGKIVFTYSIANFPTLRCLEQIRNDCAYHDANVKVVSIGGGFSYGQLGMSHHATEDLAIMRAIPSVQVCVPSTIREVEALTNFCIDTPGTCYLRLDKSFGVEPGSQPLAPFLHDHPRLIRQGSQIVAFTAGGILEEVVQAGDALEERQGISMAIYSLPVMTSIAAAEIARVTQPFDAVLTVEEGVLNGGLGSYVAECLMDTLSFPKRLKRLGLPHSFSSEVGTQKHLRQLRGLTAADIERCALNLI